MKNIFKEAHKITRKMVKEYGVDYQTQFGLCLSYLLEVKEEAELSTELSKDIIKFVKDLELDEEEEMRAIEGMKRNNKVCKEEVYDLLRTNKNTRLRLKNAGLYDYNALGGVEEGFLGKGKIKTDNLKFWSNYGKKRIYFDMIVDGVNVDNFFITIK